MLLSAALAATLGAAVAVPSASALPPGFAYEKVSPAEKDGFDVFALEARAHESGDALKFRSNGSFAGAQGALDANPYLAIRGEGSWDVHGLAWRMSPNPSGSTDAGVLGMAGSLSRMLFYTPSPTPPLVPGTTLGAQQIYMFDTEAGEYTLISPPLRNVPGHAIGTDDYEHLAFTVGDKLTPDAPDASGDSARAYEWVTSIGQLRFVGVLPDGTPGVNSAIGGGRGTWEALENAVSADGSRIIFVVGSDPQLYMRDSGSVTHHVSQSERTVPETQRPVQYRTASIDGSRVFFTTAESLTNNDTQQGEDLYMWQYSEDPEVDHNLTLISADHEPADGTEAGVRGVLGASDDGTVVYFASDGQLVADESTAPERKLYRWEQGEGIEYIGPLDADDGDTWSPRNTKASRTTPDGRFLAFESRARLTQFDNNGLPQVYLYDSATGAIECASAPRNAGPGNCNPGAPATAGARLAQQAQEDLSFAADQSHQVRYLAEDGERLYFETEQALVPADSNNRLDVYVYQDGRPYLISSGTDAYDSYFVDAGASGDTVFFATRERLLSEDRDGLADIYAARDGGGFAFEPPGSGCESDECQGPPSATPAPAEPGSNKYSGPGNPGGSTQSCAPLRRRVDRLRTRVRRLKGAARRAQGARRKRLLRRTAQARQRVRAARTELQACRRGQR